MFQPGYPITIPPMVSFYTKGIGGMSSQINASNVASATWESANGAFYYPLVLPAVCVVRRMWWVNGTTTTGGATIEAGVYADSGYGPGVKLVSGSAVQGTASQIQFVDVTDTTLAPGLYWIALSSSSATNTTLFRNTLSGGFDAAIRFEQASASPLPSTATPVETTFGNIWLCGFATTASP